MFKNIKKIAYSFGFMYTRSYAPQTLHEGLVAVFANDND